MRSRTERAEEAGKKSGALVRTRLLVDVLQVVFDGVFADATLGGNFLVGETAKDKSCDESLARGEQIGIKAPSENRHEQRRESRESGTARHSSTSWGD
jgi:hypothetical protein